MNLNLLKQTDDLLPRLRQIQLPALIVGIIGLVVWFAGMGVGGTEKIFFQSYLFAFLFALAIPLGSFGILLLHHTLGGYWGVAIRRMLESAALTLPLMALVFVPILILGLPTLYDWADPSIVAHDPILQHKAAYLNVPFFIARAAIYFLFWIGTTWFLSKWSREQDDNPDPWYVVRFRQLSGAGILFFVLTITFAAIDWGMSLDPHWFSSIYGGIFMLGQALTTFAFMILMVAALSSRKPLSEILISKQYHDLGNLLFAFTILWTYFSLSQFLIMWSGNLPEEAPWYVRRQMPGWQEIGIAIVVFQFAMPFLLLLQRFLKRNIGYLWKIALFVFLMRFVEFFWFIVPSFYKSPLEVHMMYFAAPIGFVGIWIVVFIEVLKRRPIVPLGDPLLRELASHG